MAKKIDDATANKAIKQSVAEDKRRRAAKNAVVDTSKLEKFDASAQFADAKRMSQSEAFKDLRGKDAFNVAWNDYINRNYGEQGFAKSIDNIGGGKDYRTPRPTDRSLIGVNTVQYQPPTSSNPIQDEWNKQLGIVGERYPALPGVSTSGVGGIYGTGPLPEGKQTTDAGRKDTKLMEQAMSEWMKRKAKETKYPLIDNGKKTEPKTTNYPLIINENEQPKQPKVQNAIMTITKEEQDEINKIYDELATSRGIGNSSTGSQQQWGFIDQRYDTQEEADAALARYLNRQNYKTAEEYKEACLAYYDSLMQRDPALAQKWLEQNGLKDRNDLEEFAGVDKTYNPSAGNEFSYYEYHGKRYLTYEEAEAAMNEFLQFPEREDFEGNDDGYWEAYTQYLKNWQQDQPEFLQEKLQENGASSIEEYVENMRAQEENRIVDGNIYATAEEAWNSYQEKNNEINEIFTSGDVNARVQWAANNYESGAYDQWMIMNATQGNSVPMDLNAMSDGMLDNIIKQSKQDAIDFDNRYNSIEWDDGIQQEATNIVLAMQGNLADMSRVEDYIQHLAMYFNLIDKATDPITDDIRQQVIAKAEEINSKPQMAFDMKSQYEKEQKAAQDILDHRKMVNDILAEKAKKPVEHKTGVNDSMSVAGVVWRSIMGQSTEGTFENAFEDDRSNMIWQAAQFLSDKEKEAFLYYFDTHSENETSQWFQDNFFDRLNAFRAEQQINTNTKVAEQDVMSGVLMWGAARVANLMNGLTAPAKALSTMFGDKIGYATLGLTDELVSGSAQGNHALLKKIVGEDSWWAKPLPLIGSSPIEYVYDAFTSGADSALAYWFGGKLTGQNSTYATLFKGTQFEQSAVAVAVDLIMSNEAFSSSLYQSISQGTDKWQALQNALVDAGIEGLTEIFSLEVLMGNPHGGPALVAKMLSAEASEEAVGTFASAIYSTITNQADADNVNYRAQEIMDEAAANGTKKTKQAALAQACLEVLGNAGYAALSAAISVLPNAAGATNAAHNAKGQMGRNVVNNTSTGNSSMDGGRSFDVLKFGIENGTSAVKKKSEKILGEYFTEDGHMIKPVDKKLISAVGSIAYDVDTQMGEDLAKPVDDILADIITKDAEANGVARKEVGKVIDAVVDLVKNIQESVKNGVEMRQDLIDTVVNNVSESMRGYVKSLVEQTAQEAAADGSSTEATAEAASEGTDTAKAVPSSRALELAEEADNAASETEKKVAQLYEMTGRVTNEESAKAVRKKAAERRSLDLERIRKQQAEAKETAIKSATENAAQHTTSGTYTESDDKGVTLNGKSYQIMRYDVENRTIDGHQVSVPVLVLKGADGSTETVDVESNSASNGLKFNSSGVYAIARAGASGVVRMGRGAINTMLHAYSGGNVQDYIADFDKVYNTAYDGNDVSKVETNTLNDEAVQMIAEQAKADAESHEKNRRAIASRKHNGTGKVDTKEIKDVKLNRSQRAAIDILDQIAKYTGVDFRIINDPENSAEQGSYENGLITINLSGGNYRVQNNRLMYLNADGVLVPAEKSMLLNVAGHELTHFIEENSTDEYIRLVNVVRNQMGIDEFNEQVRQRQNTYDAAGHKLTRAGAISETVADACSRMLIDTKAIADLASQDKSLYTTIKNWVKSWTSKVLQAMHNDRDFGMGTAGMAAESVGDLKFYTREVAEAWDAGLIDAVRSATTKVVETSTEDTASKDHLGAEHLSIAQFAEANGYKVLVNENGYAYAVVDANGRQVEHVTPGMIQKTPIGALIDAAVGVDGNGVTEAVAQAQRKMFADLMNLVLKYQDSGMVWELAGAQMFSSMKLNSDAQYGTTIDYGTICSKTQAIVDEMSRVMIAKGRGLTRNEVMDVYRATARSGQSVPCPVCYVFSRWMGVPSLLETMRKGQLRFDRNTTSEELNEYVHRMESMYPSDDKSKPGKGVGSQKGKIQSKLNALQKELQAKGVIRGSDILNQIDQMQKELDDIELYNWVIQVYCKTDKSGKQALRDANGNVQMDPQYKPVPCGKSNNILLNLNRTGEFARDYPKAWKFRTTRGAGMGKAILPYSGATIGDTVKGTKVRYDTKSNPFLLMDAAKSQKAIKNAITRMKKQNLIGGQRFQSTSDFRAEWGIDYMMTFLEMQAIGGKVQLYTKVIEAVDMLASSGAEVNLSIMGKGKGWHEDANGNKILDFSSVTGIDFDQAYEKVQQYDNVQMILVGLNDEHIRLAMADNRIGFIIPWHSSGSSEAILGNLMDAVNEKLENGTDYESTQTDDLSNANEYWGVRKRLLTGKLQEGDIDLIRNNPWLSDLYTRFYLKTGDTDLNGNEVLKTDETTYHVKLSGKQAGQIFPYEYWDTTLTVEDADENGKRFRDYCDSMGIVGRFTQFANDHGYWKLLIDRSMYNNDGTYHDPQPINVTNISQSSIPMSVDSAIYGKHATQAQKDDAFNAAMDAINARSNETYDMEAVETEEQDTRYSISNDDNILQELDKLNLYGEPHANLTGFNVWANKYLSKNDTRRIIEELRRPNESIPKSAKGQNIVVTNNKLVYTTGSSQKFKVTGIVYLGYSTQDEIDGARNTILDMEAGKVAETDVWEIIDSNVGIESIESVEAPVLKNATWNRSGKVETGRTFYQIAESELFERDARREHTYGSVRYSIADDTPESDIHNIDDVVRYSLIADYETTITPDGKEVNLLDYLNSQDYITTYRCFQVIDGELYPPMAENVETTEMVNGKPKKVRKRQANSAEGRWERSDEDPEHAYPVKHKDGTIVYKYDLHKTDPDTGKDNVVPAAYNPYTHSSNTVLNDQFSIAYRRPNLVVYECHIPVCELNSPARLEKATDATGWKEWKAGTVASKIAAQKSGFRRNVMLSRYCLPYRRLSNAEVAEKVKGYLEGTDVTIPFNVVWPGLRDALVDIGVKITEPAGAKEETLQKYRIPYQEWLATQKEGQLDFSDFGVKFSLAASTNMVQRVGDSADMLAKLDESLLTNDKQREAFKLYKEIYKKYSDNLKLYKEQKNLQSNKLSSPEEKEAARNRAEIYYARLVGNWEALQKARNKKALKDVIDTVDSIVDKYVLNNSETNLSKIINQLEANLQSMKNAGNETGKDELTLALTVLKSTTSEEIMDQKIKAEEKLRHDRELREIHHEILKAKHAVQKIVKDLNERYTTNADYKNVPEQFRKLVNSFLNVIAMHDAGGNRIAFDKERAGELLASYKALAAEDSRYDGMIFDDEMLEAIDALVNAVSNIGVLKGEENAYEKLVQWQIIRDVSEFVRGVVKNGNDVLIANRKETVDKAAVRMIDNLTKLGRKTIRVGGGSVMKAVDAVKNFVGWGNLTPEYFFRMINESTMTDLHRTLREGENQYGLRMGQAYDFFEATAKKWNRKDWADGKKIEFTTKNGDKVSLTVQQAMSIYATWVREHTEGQIASQHLEHGGFVLFQDKYEGKIRKEQMAPKSGTILEQSDMDNIINSLGDNIIGYVNDVVEYMSNDMSRLGNEASLQMYGIRKYKESYYFPIKSSRETMFQKSDAGAQSASNDNRLKNQGWTKSRLANANNTILIEDFDTVATGHIQQMITYSSFVVGLESMNRVLNYSFVDNRGMKTNLRAMFSETFGDDAVKYLMRFIADMNGGVSHGPTSGIEKTLSVFRKSGVAGSLSVAFKQPLSYIRAAYVMNPKWLTLSGRMGLNTKNTLAEMRKYSGVAVIKKIGRFDASLGRSAMDYMSGAWATPTAGSVAEDIMNKLPEIMDDITWAQLWRAVKAEQHDAHKELDINSEEFLTLVGRRFGDVIRATQVYDSVMVRSQNMRNKDLGSKLLTSFMAEPTLTLNMLYDSVMNGEMSKANRAKNIARAVSAYFISGVCQAVVSAAMSAGRSDDDELTWLEQFWMKFMSSVVNEVNPMASIPGYNELVDILSGNEVENAAFNPYKDAMNALYKMLAGIVNYKKSFSSAESIYKFAEDTVGMCTQIFTNLPVRNVMRDLRATINTFANMAGAASPLGGNNVSRPSSQAVINTVKIEGLLSSDFANIVNYAAKKIGIDQPFSVNNAAYYEKLYQAMIRNDEKAQRELSEYMYLVKVFGNKNPENDVKNGIRNAMKKHLKNGEITVQEATAFVMKYCPYSEKVGTYDYTYKKMEEALKGTEE